MYFDSSACEIPLTAPEVVMSLSRPVRRLPKILAVVVALVVTATPSAEAGLIQITDFSDANGLISDRPPGYDWTEGYRSIDVISNTSSDYVLQALYGGVNIA
jgi:hypothetical protein